jgi:hypothetical protein
MHAFETQRLLKADPPRFGRRDEAEILYEENTLLIDRRGFAGSSFGASCSNNKIAIITWYPSPESIRLLKGIRRRAPSDGSRWSDD